jgi:hypothetical protein
MQPTEILDREQVKQTWSELLAKGHRVEMNLGGYSMFPVLLPGDVAIFEGLKQTPLKGEVVLVALSDRWIAHRVVGVRTTQKEISLLTQGDAAPRSDGWFSLKQIKGTMISAKRNGKEIKLFDGWKGFTGRLMVAFRPFPQLISRLISKLVRSASKLFP